MELSEISVGENKLGEETVIKKSKDAENKVKEHPYVNSSFVADIDTNVQGRCENHVYEHLQRADDSAASCKRGCIARFKQYKGFMMLSLIGLVFIVAVTALAISIIGLREKTVMGERGIWNDWEPWGDCSATCSYGMERRERKCSASIGKQCYGDSSEYRICNKMLCPDESTQAVNGGWSVWESWSGCSASCNTGMESRNRTCSNPKPSKGGDYCFGDFTEYRLCNKFGCPDQSFPKVDGGWNIWGSWSECSASCGTGMASRNRSCSNPKPSNGGDYCLGESAEYQLCNRRSCPATGIGFSVYSPVSGTGGSSSSTLKFSHVVENSTGAFNTTTGEFVCRQSGLYFFSNSLIRRTSITQAAFCLFYKNDKHGYAAGYANDADPVFTSGTNAILYHLLPGDTVSLRSCQNSNQFDPDTSFTGFLVHADN